jgi:hypothetical protein
LVGLKYKREKAALAKFRFASNVALHALGDVLADTEAKSIATGVHLPVAGVRGLKKGFEKL